MILSCNFFGLISSSMKARRKVNFYSFKLSFYFVHSETTGFGGFGSFGLGGKPSAEKANTNVFGTVSSFGAAAQNTG